MAHGENGTPPAPEWFIDPAIQRCIGCNTIKVSCEAEIYYGSKCCGFCSHDFTSLEMKLPALWDGDQA